MKLPLIILLVLTTMLTACKKGPAEGGELIILKDNKLYFYLNDAKFETEKNTKSLIFLENITQMQKYNNIGNRTSYSGVIPTPKNPDNCFIFPKSLSTD